MNGSKLTQKMALDFSAERALLGFVDIHRKGRGREQDGFHYSAVGGLLTGNIWSKR